MKRLITLLILWTAPAWAVTATAHLRPHHSIRAPKFHRKPISAFPASPDSLFRQNAEIERLGLYRYKNETDLRSAIFRHELVPLPLGPHLKVDPRLDPIRRYCRPWTAQFLTDISDAFYAKFHKPLQVNSAVRTVEFQEQLRKRNGNAAPDDGPTASSHLAGLTIDLARKGMNRAQVRFMEEQLLILNIQHKVEVEEEFEQLCFHIMVTGRYSNVPSISAVMDLGLISF